MSDPWATAVEDFTTAMRAAGRAPGTVRLHRHYLRQVAALNPDPWTVTTGQLAAWLAAPSWKPETRKSARSTARSFYWWALRNGHVGTSPADLLDPVKVPHGVPRPAPTKALDRALEGATDRERLMILLGAYAGLRAHEIAKVHPGDLVDGQQLRICGKGGRVRVVPVHPILSAALDRELERRSAGGHGTGWRYTVGITPGGPLFPNADGEPVGADNVIHTLSRLLGAGWTAHTLRHRFATAAYAVSGDLRAVQELLGHSKPETTSRYVAVADSALRAAVEGIR